MTRHIVVIGGGIAGTSAAYFLRSRGYRVTIVERSNQLGGRVRSQQLHGAAVEMGAGFITNAYTNIRTFLTTSSLDQKLYRQHGRSGILRGGKVKMATISDLAGNETLSWGAKLKMIPLIFSALLGWRRLDMHAPWKAERYDNQTISERFQDKASKELLEYVIQPILNGYFYWTAERTSMAMMLIILKAMLQGGTQKLAGGLQQIPEKAAEDCKVLLGHEVLGVEKTNETFTIVIRYRDETKQLYADGVVCATTASKVSKIIPSLTKIQKDFFDSIQYSSTAVLAQAYPIDQTLGDRGLAFPRSEGSALAAITVSPEKVGEAYLFGSVKAYASGSLSGVRDMSDEELKTRLLNERMSFDSTVLSGNNAPEETYFQRWPEALPILGQGHFRKLRLFAEGKIEEPRSKLVFAGDYLGGPFMEGAFTSGIQAAKRLDAQFK